jgi:hypothetical protein
LWGRPPKKFVQRDARPFVNDGHGTVVYSISLVHFHHLLMLNQINRLRKRFVDSFPRVICSDQHRAILDEVVIGKPVKLPVRVKVLHSVFNVTTLVVC